MKKNNNKFPMCRGCGSIENHERITSREMFLGSRRSFSYILCGGCRSLFIEQIPNDLSSFYKDYYSFSNNRVYKSGTFRTFARQMLFSKIETLGKASGFVLGSFDDLKLKALYPYVKSKGSKILDVGCGSGDFLDDLAALKFSNLLGVDPFLETDRLSKWGVQLLSSEANEVNGKYDIITLHHVFEHMEEPLERLKELKNLLMDKGTIVVRMPNIESYSFRQFGASWEGIHAPYHFFLPSFSCFLKLVSEAGLKIVEKRSEQKLSLILNSVAHSLDVSDYEPLGPRYFFENHYSLFNSTPPLFMRSEVKHWKKKLRHIVKRGMTDWVVYYLSHG